MAAFHPDPGLLMDYATGALDESRALLVASHLSLCPACRADVAAAEELGGELLTSIAPVPLSGTARIDLEELSAAVHAKPVPPAIAGDIRLPEPLRSYVAKPLEELKWQRLLPGVREAILLKRGRTEVSLLQIRAGKPVPVHTHEGHEMTLVLAGGFSDATGHYGRGDVSQADPGLNHQPVADLGEDCLCLSVVEGGLRLTGPLGRILNLFRRA